jgi:enterochelin esterase-like enzyme
MTKSYGLIIVLIVILASCLSGCNSRNPIWQGNLENIPTYVPLPTSTTTPPVNSTPTPEQKLQQPLNASASCLETTGRIEAREVPVQSDNSVIKVRVYLPPCYTPHPTTNYPLLILLHGKLFTEDQWERLGATKAADALISSGEVIPFIIAMPRENDTTGDALTSDFGDKLVQVVLPWLEQTYPLNYDRQCKALGGLSRGAFWAYRTGMLNWKIFGAIGGHSLPDTQFTEYYFRDLLKNIPSGQLPRLYLDSGSNDIALKDATSFESLLVRYSVPHTWQLFPGDHSETYWSAHVYDYLRWYAVPWKQFCITPAQQTSH